MIDKLKINWKALLPHAVAVLVFLTLTLVYFSPVLQGKDIMQDDAIGSMGWGRDAKEYHEESGEYARISHEIFDRVCALGESFTDPKVAKKQAKEQKKNAG